MNNQNNFLKLLPFLVVILLDVMGVVLVLPILTPLILQPSTMLPAGTPLLWRDFLYGFSIAIFPLFMFFSTPVLGDLSDKFGRKKILLLCLAGGALSYFIAALGIIFNSLFVLFLGRAIAGLMAGTQPIASAAIIDMSTSENRTKNLGWVVFFSSFGLIIGPLLGGLTAEKNLVSWFGYETPFFLAGILALLNAIFLFYSTASSPIKKEEKISFTKGFVLFIAAFTEKKFRLLSILFAGYMLAWSLYFQAINWILLERFHYTTAKLGLFVGYMGLVFALVTSLIMPAVLRIFKNDSTAYLFFIFIMAIANIGCALTPSEWPQWVWVIFNAIGNVFCYTIGLNLFSRLVDADSQGWIMGVTGAIAALTWAFGGTIAGPLGFVNLFLPIWVAGGLSLLSFLLMLLYRKRHHAA